jgi:nitroreductase
MDRETIDRFDHLLMTARSVRRRLDFERPVEPEVIERCIEVAVQAPTGGNREGWRFLVLTEPEPKAQVAAVYRRSFERYAAEREAEARRNPESARPVPRPQYGELAANLERVPALIICCIEGRPEPDSVAQQVALYGSILPAAWSLMLALRARGLGATWTTLHLRHEREAAEALGIPEGVTQTVLLPVGYTRNATLRPAERKPAREVPDWNRWGERR